MRMQKGFTLVELMVVVVIVAILFTFAIPSYQDYVIRGILVEASSALSNGRIQMEQFYQDNRTYVGGPCPTTTANFIYACANPGGASTYSIVAGGTGRVVNFNYLITETNLKTSNTPWGNGATCWIMKKGTTC
jgi:type IV pilus assembly protein PilE